MGWGGYYPVVSMPRTVAHSRSWGEGRKRNGNMYRGWDTGPKEPEHCTGAVVVGTEVSDPGKTRTCHDMLSRKTKRANGRCSRLGQV